MTTENGPFLVKVSSTKGGIWNSFLLSQGFGALWNCMDSDVDIYGLFNYAAAVFLCLLLYALFCGILLFSPFQIPSDFNLDGQFF